MPRNVKVRLPHAPYGIARARKRFLHPLLTNKPATMIKSTQTYITYTYVMHICELTRIEWVSPALSTSYPQQKCCSISPAFILSHPP